MSEPAVSVVMPVYNGEKWLSAAIESVLAQTLDAWELIVVDDGSADASAGIATGYAGRDRRIQVVRQHNSGAAAARNKGRETASGRWIASLDADDVAEPTRLASQLAFAEAQNLVLAGSGFTQIDAAGTLGRVYSYPAGDKALRRRLQRLMGFPPASSAFFSRSLADRLGGYRPQLNHADDWDLWIRLAENGRLGALKAPLVRIRLHGEQMTHHGNGRLQPVQACAAIVAHYLRSAGLPDPASSPSGAGEFVAWVEERMTAAGYFDERGAWQRARAAALASGRISGLARFAAGLVRSGHAPALLRQKFFGNYLPRRLAAEWVRR